ncbi:ATP-binding protein [Streptomyces sp. NPDC002138]|uniref:ATP-binding protein n=1 Tax=Streptomyces sp. NPDC002138 TaxID=3154410 RepID=UPI0033346B89
MLTAPDTTPAPCTTPAPRTSPATAFVRWAVEPTAAAVPRIRSRVRAALDDWRVAAEVADVLLLAVSELTGNVVLHAATTPRMRVGVALRGGWLHLDVSDGSRTPARPPAPGAEVDPDAETGRGLLIVRLMVAEAGGELAWAAAEFGKAVRVRVPVAGCRVPVAGCRSPVAGRRSPVAGRRVKISRAIDGRQNIEILAPSPPLLPD